MKKSNTQTQKAGTEIPEGWEVKTLAQEIDQLEAGVSVNSTDDAITSNTRCILKTSAVFDGAFYPEECKRIKDSDLHRAKVNPIKNSIIISRMNTPALVGELGFVKETFPTLYLPDRLWQTRIKKNSPLNIEWLSYLLNTPSYKLKIKCTATGTSNSMKNISKDAFLAIQILMPTPKEQRAIATCLSTWDKAINKTQALITQKEQRKRWLMQQLLTGKKRLKGFESKTWKKSGAGEVFTSISIKGFDNEDLLSSTQDKGIIPRSLLEARVTMPTGDTKTFKLVEPGDFVISLRSFQGGLEYSYYRGIVSPAYTVLKPKVPINEEFYKQYFKSYDFIGHLAIAVIGIRDGKQISYEDFRTVKIPVPSVQEQTAIAQVLQAADKEIQTLKQQLDKLKEQKKGLMQVLLTGKKRLKIKYYVD